MVDMGFYDDIVAIASHCPTKRQTLLFSATYPDNIRKLAARFAGRGQGRGPARRQPHRADLLRDQARGTPGRRRPPAGAFRPASTLAFCNTKIRSHDLVEALNQQGVSALALNGDLEQREREILIQFANNSCSVLVATDVAARDWTSRTWAPSSTST